MPIDRKAVDALLARARREVDDGLLPSCQLAIGYEGEIVASAVFGDATEDTRYVAYSATKPFIAAAIWSLMGDGLVATDARVVDYFPEFGAEGKDKITVEQVLLHTSGFPMAPMGPPEWFTRDGRVRRMTGWRLNWEPGTRYEYHATSAHWVLAEIIERVTGKDFREAVHARVTQPLGLPRVVGIPEDQQEGIATVEIRGDAATPDELQAAFGIREFPMGEVTHEALLRFNEPKTRALGVPGGGAIMRSQDLALFYQGLLHNPGGVWKPDVLADATSNVRNRLRDPLLRMPANRSIGVFIAGDDGFANLRGMGRTVSPRAFGHPGAGGQLAWADPATGLSFGYCTNGVDQNVVREPRRGTAINSLAAVCASAA